MAVVALRRDDDSLEASMRSQTVLPVVALLALAGCSSTPTRHISGAQTFETHCASCHGPRGEGDGPVAATLLAPVPNLRTLAARNGGEFPTDRAASYIDGRAMPAAHGGRAMPVWGDVFDVTNQLFRGAESAEQRIEAVIAYLRELQDP
jgi:mono/diheme cytochrome c family protein